MPGPVVFTEKLRCPEAAGLCRSRLERPLLDPAVSTDLDVIVGPPGSGKTTLLARVAQQSTLPVAWYRLTADDRTESTLAAHLASALQPALHTRVAAGNISELLASIESTADIKAVTVFDDAHEIAGSSAERALERFIGLRPRSIRVLIGSRRMPTINIPRLRVSGSLREIDADDLRFRSWEVEELFLTVFGEPLSPEAAASLTRRLGGWAAGLQLFHLATRGRNAQERHQAVADLNGRSRLVRYYLARNVIAELPHDRREFLLKTSTLGLLNGQLCDQLLQTSGSGRILDDLEQQQLFTSSDDDGATFHYHEVLRAHLEWALVEEFGVEQARYWYTRSSSLLESAGHFGAAITASAKADDWVTVARLHRQAGTGATAVQQFVEPLPPAVVHDDPWLSLADGRRRVRDGALDAGLAAFQQAEMLLDEPSFQDCCRHERGAARLWSGGTSSWPGDVRTQEPHWSAQIRAATRGNIAAANVPAGLTDADAVAAGVICILRRPPGHGTGAARYGVERRTDLHDPAPRTACDDGARRDGGPRRRDRAATPAVHRRRPGRPALGRADRPWAGRGRRHRKRIQRLAGQCLSRGQCRM